MEGTIITIEDLKSDINDGWFLKIEKLRDRNPTLHAAYFFKRGSEERLLRLLKLFFDQQTIKADLENIKEKE